MNKPEDFHKERANLELNVEQIPIDQLKPSRSNARTHSAKQIRQIARSIETLGFINPVIVDAEDGVIAGHGRLAAARLLGLSHIPTIRVEHLSEGERRAYMLADNKIAENAGWDQALLRVELSELASVDLGFDVELSGFAAPEIDVILGRAATEDPIEAEPALPEIADDPVSRAGDLWVIGSHRLLCADTRDTPALDRLMQGNQARMVITDPPYNVPIGGHVSGLGRTRHREFMMGAGELSSEAFTDVLVQCLGNLARVSMDGALHYVFMDWRHLRELLDAAQGVYSDQINLCVWTKTNGGMGSLYRSQHELIGVFKVGQAPHLNHVELGRHGRYRTNVWQYPGMNTFSEERAEALRLHPTVKPVRLVADAILDVTRRGEIVLDGFMGSGTTILAAERVGRIAYGVELDPQYVDVAIRRWQDATGEKAHLNGSAATFDVVSAERIGTAKERES